MAKEVVEVAASATARVRHTIDEVRKILASRGAEVVKATILNARIITVGIENENGDIVRQENRFVLNLDKDVKGTWKNGDERTVGDSNTIIVSPIGMYAIVGREPLFSRFLTKWHESPALLCSHLSECEITLAQEEVKAGTVYVNPFNDKENDIKNDTIINTPLDIVPKGLSKKHMEDQLMNVSLF